MSIKISKFGTLSTGIEIKEYCMRNTNGMEVKILNYGGIITSVLVPDKNGKFENVVLAYTDLLDYERDNCFLGCVIGRYANRIAKACFSLNGKEYQLEKNLGNHSLHGGKLGFNKKVWSVKVEENQEIDCLYLHYLSENGEEGFPGNLQMTTMYSLNNENEFCIEYRAKTDQTTIFNPTQHSYFNLSGNPKKDILSHQLLINSDRFLSTDEELIPDGKIISVQDNPMDFRKLKHIGNEIETDFQALKIGNGYDHCWVLKKETDFSLAAVLVEPVSKRKLEIFTTEPGMQFYTGNYLQSFHGEFDFRCGMGLETQHFPDSPNRSEFPLVVLEDGKEFFSKSSWKFGIQK